MNELQSLADNQILLIISIPAIAAWIALSLPKPFRMAPGAITILATAGGLVEAIVLATQAFTNPITARLAVSVWLNPLVASGPEPAQQVTLTFRADALTTTALVTFSLIFFIAALQSYRLAASQNLRSYYYFLLLLASAGASGAALAGDLLTLYLFCELATFALAPMLLGHLKSADVAAARKFLASSIAISIPMFFGIVWLITNSRVVGLKDLWAKQVAADFDTTSIVIAGLLLAFALKAGLIPLHAWLVEATDSAITPLGVLLTSAITQIGAYAMVRVGFGAFELGASWSLALAAAGGASAVLGAIGAMDSRGHQKALGYLALGQMGFVLIALGAATPLGDAAALFRLVSFSACYPLLFIAAAEIRRTATEHHSWQQRMRSAPIAFAALVVGSLGIAGIPPFGGFAPNVLVFQALLDLRAPAWWALTAILFIATALTVAASINAAIRAFRPTDQDDVSLEPTDLGAKIAMVVLIVSSVGLGLTSNLVLVDVIRPLVATTRTMPTASVATRGDFWVATAATALFVAAVFLGSATYMRRTGLLHAQDIPYARSISFVVSPVLLLTPVYRALAYLLKHDLLDAYAAGRAILNLLAYVAYAIVDIAARHAPDSEATWDYQDEANLPEAGVTPP
ncbi:MAG: hypothetical protein HYY30_08610 [Chloroflexi bacterium]|nr:hypothetical protein [Chloroflexota bacterium]